MDETRMDSAECLHEVKTPEVLQVGMVAGR